MRVHSCHIEKSCSKGEVTQKGGEIQICAARSRARSSELKNFFHLSSSRGGEVETMTWVTPPKERGDRTVISHADTEIKEHKASRKMNSKRTQVLEYGDIVDDLT